MGDVFEQELLLLLQTIPLKDLYDPVNDLVRKNISETYVCKWFSIVILGGRGGKSYPSFVVCVVCNNNLSVNRLQFDMFERSVKLTLNAFTNIDVLCFGDKKLSDYIGHFPPLNVNRIKRAQHN